MIPRAPAGTACRSLASSIIDADHLTLEQERPSHEEDAIVARGRSAVVGVAVAAAVPQSRDDLWPTVKPPRRRRRRPAAPAPGVPVTAGTVEAKDVPVLLNGIGTVQAYNMVTIKSRVDGQIVKVAFTEGQEVKAGDPLIQIDPRGFQAALEQVASRPRPRTRRSSPTRQPDLARYAQLVGPGFQTQAELRSAKGAGRAAAGGDQGRPGADRHRPGQPQLLPISARRSRAGSAFAWSMSAIWCARPTTPGW